MRSFFKYWSIATAATFNVKLPKGVYVHFTLFRGSAIDPADGTVLNAALIKKAVEPTGLPDTGSLAILGWDFQLDAAPVTRTIFPHSCSERIYIENKTDDLWLHVVNTTGSTVTVIVQLLYYDLNSKEQLEGIFERGNK